MRKHDLTDTKALDIKSLKGKAAALRGEIDEMVMQKNMSGLKDTKSIGKKHKDLAQIMTIIAQKEYLAFFEKAEAESSDSLQVKGGK